MATKNKITSATAKKELSAASITEMFMHYCLENNKRPESVYLFSKQHEFSEKEFYAFFPSLDAIEKQVFVSFHQMARQLISQSNDMGEATFREHLLTYYFTFFEILTANRSYVVFALQNDKSKLNGLLKLNRLRGEFKEYIQEISSGYLKVKSDKVKKVQQDALEEGAWIQLLVTMKFWLDDESVGFEKTDLFIEKSIRATFDLFDVTPLESVIDLGKFLFKEKVK